LTAEGGRFRKTIEDAQDLVRGSVRVKWGSKFYRSRTLRVHNFENREEKNAFVGASQTLIGFCHVRIREQATYMHHRRSSRIYSDMIKCMASVSEAVPKIDPLPETRGSKLSGGIKSYGDSTYRKTTPLSGTMNERTAEICRSTREDLGQCQYLLEESRGEVILEGGWGKSLKKTQLSKSRKKNDGGENGHN